MRLATKTWRALDITDGRYHTSRSIHTTVAGGLFRDSDTLISSTTTREKKSVTSTQGRGMPKSGSYSTTKNKTVQHPVLPLTETETGLFDETHWMRLE